jgi:hypothetical protein
MKKLVLMVVVVILWGVWFPVKSFGSSMRYPPISKLPVQTNTPDPLIEWSGKRVKTRREWMNHRRPELKDLFQHYMYGTMPPAPKNELFMVEHDGENFFEGKATGREVSIFLDNGSNAPVIHLLIIVPTSTKEKNANAGGGRGVPVFLGLNFCGNFALTSNTVVAVPESWMGKGCPGCVDGHATEAGRGTQAEMWDVERTIDRGYALATFYCGDVEPDKTDATTGIRAYWGYSSSNKPPKDCGVIAAWAWGISRAVDYLQTDKDIDAKRIAVVGHSRLGKATAVAAAFDERIALAIPLQAGCGGTAPSRGTIGESVKAINDRFPHWFNDEFKKFDTEPARLPFDQNCLIAMIAPRAVLIGCATEDEWSNPAGQFEMMRRADEVYRLLGVDGLDAKEMPPENQLVGNRLGYFIRPGKHSMTKLDWGYFLDYADKVLK